MASLLVKSIAIFLFASILSTTLAAAKLIFIGGQTSFDCPSKTYNNDTYKPNFDFKENGKTTFTVLYYGADKRPNIPKNIAATQNGDSFTYTVSDIIGQNGGIYRCDYSIENVEHPLTVIHNEMVCPDKLETVKMGEKLKGSCYLKKMGSEELNIKWKIEDTVLGSVVVDEVNNSTCDLDVVAEPRFNGATLDCFFDDIQGVKPCSVVGSVEYPPQNVVISPPTQKQLQGEEATVKCEASNANPETITVAFKTKKGHEEEYKDAPTDTDGELTITVDDDYTVQCLADNGVGPIVNATEEARILLVVPARITGPLVQSPNPAMAEKQVNITCPVEPDLAIITWTKEGVEVPGNGKLLSMDANRADLNAVVVCSAIVNDTAVSSASVNASIVLDVAWDPIVDSTERSKDGNGIVSYIIVVSGSPTPNVTLNFVNSTANSTATSEKLVDGTTVFVTLKVDEKELPIFYNLLVKGRDEPLISKGSLPMLTPTTTPEPATVATTVAMKEAEPSNAGMIAGIIIAIILIIICAALLVIMWKKNLLCPKKGHMDMEKGVTASSDGGMSKPVELEDVQLQPEAIPVEETENKLSAPLLDDDDIKKPPVLENGQTEIIPTEPRKENLDDQPPPAPGTPPPPPPIV